jgi:hypothetical protein
VAGGGLITGVGFVAFFLWTLALAILFVRNRVGAGSSPRTRPS